MTLVSWLLGREKEAKSRNSLRWSFWMAVRSRITFSGKPLRYRNAGVGN